MSSELSPLTKWFKQPAYTGENRCLPCTAVNLVIAAVVSGLAALVSPVLAVAVGVVSLAAIYFRGYLVPGTPALTQRYLPDAILRRFDKAGPRDPATEPPEFDVLQKLDEERESGVVAREFVEDVGVVQPATDGCRRQLTPEFTAAMDERVTSLRSGSVSHRDVADVFDAKSTEVTALDRAYPAYEVGIQIRKWPSETAFVADVASHQVFDEWSDRWADVPVKQRVDMLQHVRSLRSTCPACGGQLEQSEDAIDSCCRSAEVVILSCRDCGDRLLEADPQAADLPQPTRL